MTTTVRLLDEGSVVVDGRLVTVSDGGLRLLALLALADAPVPRRGAAATLWPDAGPGRAAGNLRTALWRLRGAGCDVVDARGALLAIRADVVVDVREPLPVTRRTTTLLWRCGDDWLDPERDRLQLSACAQLVARSDRLIRAGRCAQAIEAALGAVALDPLDEEARLALVRAHLAEGNLVEARRAVGAYGGLVRRELGVEPGPRFTALLGAAVRARPVTHR